jgi:hypothetical protein
VLLNLKFFIINYSIPDLSGKAPRVTTYHVTHYTFNKIYFINRASTGSFSSLKKKDWGCSSAVE